MEIYENIIANKNQFIIDYQLFKNLNMLLI